MLESEPKVYPLKKEVRKFCIETGESLRSSDNVLEICFFFEGDALTEIRCGSLENDSTQHKDLSIRNIPDSQLEEQLNGLYRLAIAGEMTGRALQIAVRALVLGLSKEQHQRMLTDFPE